MKTLFHVKGVPFFSVGGQVNNSTPYSAEKVETVFSHVKDFGLNTVAAPVYWELLEPEEGHYDFAQTDMLMQAARRHGLQLVLLWFGTWKNGNSHYIPRWMKLNGKRFPMAKSADGFRSVLFRRILQQRRRPTALLSARCAPMLHKTMQMRRLSVSRLKTNPA